MKIEDINNVDPRFKKLVCLNQKQTAQILGISNSTLENWRSLNIGPSFLKVNSGKRGRILYDKTAICDWVNQTIKTV